MAVEDTYGLWELLWQLEGEFPDVDQEVVRRVARDALHGLIREGLLELVRWDSQTTARTTLGGAESDRALGDPAAWNPTGELRPHIRFTATPAGERVYFAPEVSA